MPDGSNNDLYLAALDLKGTRALVVGGSEMAAEKIEGLRQSGADVTVVAPDVCPSVRALIDSGEVEWLARAYAPADLDGCLLVVATTGEGEISESVARDARNRSMLVNVADVPRLCNFILPAIVRRGPIAVAVSTGGTSPALAQRIRSEISERVGPAYAELAEELSRLRPWAKESLPTYEQRKAFFEAIVNASPDPVELLKTGDRDEVIALIERARRAAAGASA